MFSTRTGPEREPREVGINLTHARKQIVELVVPEVRANLQAIYAEHQRARAESRISPLAVGEMEAGSIEPTNSNDVAIDGLLQKRLGVIFPQAIYLSEDSLKVSRDPRLKSTEPAYLREVPWLWIVDATDGTGRLNEFGKRFSVSIALAHKGKVVLGVVHKPVGHPRTYWAQADEDRAYLNGERIEVSKITEAKKAMISTAYAWDPGDRAKNLALLKYIGTDFNQPALNTASSILDILQVAEGQIAGHFSEGLKLWDKAAASLIVEKAGGRSTDPFQGRFVATNGFIHDELVGMLQAAEERIAQDVKEKKDMMRMQERHGFFVSIPTFGSGIIFEIAKRTRDQLRRN